MVWIMEMMGMMDPASLGGEDNGDRAADLEMMMNKRASAMMVAGRF